MRPDQSCLITDFSTVNPEGEHVKIQGERWYKFSVDYPHGGRKFSFEIYARSTEEAHSMVAHIQNWAQPPVQVILTIPSRGPRWLGDAYANFVCWMKNTIGMDPWRWWPILCFILIILLFLK